MSNVKLTLEDGTEYRNGERILYRINDKECVERIVCVKPLSLTHVTINAIAANPHLFRKLPPRTTRNMNDAEFLALLRKHGAGIEVKDKYGAWHGGARYYIEPNKTISVNGFTVIGLTHYRTSDDGYTEEHELTVEVER